MKILSQIPWTNKFLLLFSILFISACNNPTSSDADPLEKFAGAHIRVAWVQEQGAGADTYGFGENFKLMGYDSRDGKKERALLDDIQNFYKPIITPDGKKVVVSSRSRHEIYLVDFKKGKKKFLGKGVAVDVWQDPDTKKVWVYALAGDGPENKYFTTHPLVRFPIKKPKKREDVWNKTHLSWSNFDMSRDGKFAGGLFPWPHAGILLFEQDTWKQYGKGCWTALSPDSSAILWVFDGLHRNLNFVNPFTAEFWTTNINTADGIGGFEVYHPRWSNHVRYLTMTGPYVEGEGGNKINGGGQKVEVHVGRFSPDLKTVEEWFQVTHNDRADFYPDVWIANGSESNFSTTQAKAIPAVIDDSTLEWPGNREQLVFLWQDVMAENKLSEKSLVGFNQFRVTPKQRAYFNRYLEMDFNRSALEASLPVGKAAAVIQKQKGLGLELLYTPAATEKRDTGYILRLRDKEQNDFLRLAQKGNGLQLEILSAKKIIGTMKLSDSLHAKRPEHLFIKLTENQLAVYSNGRLADTVAMSQNPLNSFPDLNILFGNLNDSPLNGALSHIAIYAGVTSDTDITRKSHMVTGDLESRKDIETIEFSAELIEVSAIPAPDSLGAYSRALVVNRYRLAQLTEGVYSAKEMLVAQWAVLDRTVLSEAKDFTVGSKLKMKVEKFDDHPELEGERLMMDMFDPDLEIYYQVSS